MVAPSSTTVPDVGSTVDARRKNFASRSQNQYGRSLLDPYGQLQASGPIFPVPRLGDIVEYEGFPWICHQRGHTAGIAAFPHTPGYHPTSRIAQKASSSTVYSSSYGEVSSQNDRLPPTTSTPTKRAMLAPSFVSSPLDLKSELENKKSSGTPRPSVTYGPGSSSQPQTTSSRSQGMNRAGRGMANDQQCHLAGTTGVMQVSAVDSPHGETSAMYPPDPRHTFPRVPYSLSNHELGKTSYQGMLQRPNGSYNTQPVVSNRFSSARTRGDVDAVSRTLATPSQPGDQGAIQPLTRIRKRSSEEAQAPTSAAHVVKKARTILAPETRRLAPGISNGTTRTLQPQLPQPGWLQNRQILRGSNQPLKTKPGYQKPPIPSLSYVQGFHRTSAEQSFQVANEVPAKGKLLAVQASVTSPQEVATTRSMDPHTPRLSFTEEVERIWQSFERKDRILTSAKFVLDVKEFTTLPGQELAYNGTDYLAEFDGGMGPYPTWEMLLRL